jgi:hypothetical protein
MQSSELEDYFGAPVFVQFRDGMALVTAGDATEYAPINRAMQPEFREQRGAPGWLPVGTTRRRSIQKQDEERTPIYALTLECRILPGDGERVYVVYESGEYAARMAVRPSDIVAVTWIEGRIDGKQEERIVR